jgi:hypothetical protein
MFVFRQFAEVRLRVENKPGVLGTVVGIFRGGFADEGEEVGRTVLLWKPGFRGLEVVAPVTALVTGRVPVPVLVLAGSKGGFLLRWEFSESKERLGCSMAANGALAGLMNQVCHR